MSATRRATPAREKRRAGFALLAVIWGTGLISLLVVSFMSTGRLRLQTAFNVASATQATYIADGVISLATLALLAERDAPAAQGQNVVYDGAPKFCVFDGAAVALSIEEESGKVDLNAASPELLQSMLTALGLEAGAAEQIAKAIVAYRSPPGDITQPRVSAAASDKPFAPKQAPFETVLELDQVSGVSPGLFRDLLPFVTVHSRTPTVDPRASPPALFAAFAGMPPAIVQALRMTPYPNTLNREDARFPATFKGGGERGAYLVHVETLLATGQTAARDAILDMRPTNGKPFALKEVRRGLSHYVERLRQVIATNGAGVPDC